jgi:hypothetical protein
MNFTTLVLSRFKLLAANRLITCERTKFDTEETSLKFLLEIMTLVSSANNNGSHIQFILRRRSFQYIMNYIGPIIDHWGTPCLNVTQSDKKKILVVLGDFTSTFCPLNRT